MLTNDQREALEEAIRWTRDDETASQLRSILYASAAPGEGREPASERPAGYVLEIDGRINWLMAADTRPGAEGLESTLLYNTAPRDRKKIRVVPVYTRAALATAPTMSEAALTDGVLSVIVTEARRAGNYQEAFERVKRKVTRLAEIERIDRAAAKEQS